MISIKAKINGIEVEGSPQEIVDYVKRMDDLRREGVHIKPPLGNFPFGYTGDPNWEYQSKITCAGTQNNR